MSTAQDASDTRSERWPKTLWDVLESEDEDRILKHLCAEYREPIVEWFRKDPFLHGQAEELAHSFIEGNWVEGPIGFKRDIEKQTRFRSWVVACLGHFLDSAKRRHFAAKRGAGQHVGTLDEEALQVAAGASGVPEGFDLTLAGEIDAKALGVVRAQWEASDWGDRFRGLADHVPASDDPPSIGALAKATGLGKGNVKKQLHLLREAYHEAFEAAVRPLCSSAEFQAEFRHLYGLAALWVALGRRKERKT